MCAPSLRPLKACGEEQDEKAAASIRHSKVEPASVEVNVKLGLAVVRPVGPPVMKVSGAASSTVKLRTAGVESCWESPVFVERTSKV